MIQISILFAPQIRKAVQIVTERVELGVILPNSSVMVLNMTLTEMLRAGFIVGTRQLNIPQVSFFENTNVSEIYINDLDIYQYSSFLSFWILNDICLGAFNLEPTVDEMRVKDGITAGTGSLKNDPITFVFMLSGTALIGFLLIYIISYHWSIDYKFTVYQARNYNHQF